MQITLMDVAREAGVSRATASLVIRNSPLVADATRRKVEEAIEKLGYVRNLAAARLRESQSRVIGLIVPNLVNPFFAEFLDGIETVVNDAGLAVLLANSHDDHDRQIDVITRMREHGVDGLIVCPAQNTQVGVVSSAQKLRMPIVQVLRRVDDALDYVGPDYRGGVETAVDYLVGLGHGRIAFAVLPERHYARDRRLEGFEASLKRHGLSPSGVYEMPKDVSAYPGATEALLASALKPTATICFNDLTAIGLSAGMSDRGMVVGKHHSIVSFDDILIGELHRPRLTSVSTFPARLGGAAARQMLARLERKGGEAETVITETRLIVRQSCGPALSAI